MQKIKKLKISRNNRGSSTKGSRFLVDLKPGSGEQIEPSLLRDKESNYSRYAKVRAANFEPEAEDIFAELDQPDEEKGTSRKIENLFFIKILKAIFAFVSQIGKTIARPVHSFFLWLKRKISSPQNYKDILGSTDFSQETRIELIPRQKKKIFRFFQSKDEVQGMSFQVSSDYLEADFIDSDQGGIFVSEDKEGLTPLPLFSFARFQRVHFRSALVFALIMTVFVLPLKSFDFYEFVKNQKGEVLGVSEEAVANLFAATTNASQMNFSLARENFDKAEKNFQQIEKQVGSWKILLNALGKILPLQKIQMGASVDNVLRAGELGARIGENLSGAMMIVADKEASNKEKILSIEKHFSYAHDYSVQLNKELEQIDPQAIPSEYQEIFVSLKDKSIFVEDMFQEVLNLIKALENLSGFDYDKRYLLVFQNNTEMRASGGFIGSFAILDLANGEIKAIDIPPGGSYDLQGGMYTQVAAPGPLQLVSPQWFFWDANWWPDWPTSAKKLEWFLDKSQGPSVDGVISFTPTVMEWLLEIVGPIDMGEEYGLQIDKDNFWDVVQTFSEQKPLDHPDHRPNIFLNQKATSTVSTSTAVATSSTVLEEKILPKKIIGDIFPLLMDQIKANMDKDLLLSFLKIIERSFQEKQSLVYFKDQDLQSLAEERKWSGQIEETNYDYLQIVNTNIAGGKSDKIISNHYNLQTKILADGRIENTLLIKRIHSGVKGQRFRGVRNVNWLRVYVPEGSELISARGFESPDPSLFEDPDPAWLVDPDIERAKNTSMTHQESKTEVYHELGKTVFANWMIVDPSESSQIVIKYRLPFSVNDHKEGDGFPHMLTWQKQPGSLHSEILYNFDPAYMRITSSGSREDCLEQVCDLNKDQYWYYILDSKQAVASSK